MSKRVEVVDCLGIDVAKRTFDAAFATADCAGQGVRPGRLPARHFARTEEGVAELLTWLTALRNREDAPGQVLVVMEATGRYSVELAAWLPVDGGMEVAIVNGHDAAHHRKSLGVRTHTDALAARALALFGLDRRPQPYVPLTPEQAKLRALSRYRESLVNRRAAVNKQLQEVENPWVRREQKREQGFFDRQIARIENEMKQHVCQHDTLREQVTLLTTIPGVAFITASKLLAELGDLRRFHRARQLSAFAGLSPEHHDSGTSVHRPARMSKKGNGRVREALYLAALTTIRYVSGLTTTYNRLLGQGKQKMQALGAVMRKMLLVMRAMLIHNEPFQRHCRAGGKKRQEWTLQTPAT